LCHGGVIALRNSGQHRDSQVETREDIKREEKIKTAEYDRGNYWRRSNGSLAKYHLTKGFRGTNGAEISAVFTTPEIREAKIKQFSMRQCQEFYVLCDSSKIGKVSSVTFAGIEEARVITTGLSDEQYRKCDNIIQI